LEKVGSENWEIGDIQLLHETKGSTHSDIEKVLDEYSYPGELYQDLHYESEIDGIIDLELSLSKRQLFQQMSRAGITYYTGKPAPELPDPPDVYEYSGPEMDRIRYELLGREEDNQLCHFYRAADSSLEILVFEQDFDGGLEREKLNRFGHSPIARLQHYIEERDWEILKEPDYTELEEQYREEVDPEITESVDTQGQSTWQHWQR
jgi:hypothetical protein